MSCPMMRAPFQPNSISTRPQGSNLSEWGDSQRGRRIREGGRGGGAARLTAHTVCCSGARGVMSRGKQQQLQQVHRSHACKSVGKSESPPLSRASPQPCLPSAASTASPQPRLPSANLTCWAPGRSRRPSAAAPCRDPRSRHPGVRRCGRGSAVQARRGSVAPPRP